MECLIIRLDAPMMSFGAVLVDQINPVWRFPGTSMLAGLFGNAMGWDHGDTDRLQAVQERLRFAARWDAEPELWTDYQIVDLGHPHMVDTGWTTHGRREERKGASGTATHQRWRDYWVNGVVTLAVALDGAGEPDLGDLAAALGHPARPLFLGRKGCLPAGPLLIGRREAPTVKAGLEAEPMADIGFRRRPDRVSALWPYDEGEGQQLEEKYDLRDWAQNIHRGSRRYAFGYIQVTP